MENLFDPSKKREAFNEHKVTLNIVGTQYRISSINGIDMDRVRARKYALGVEDPSLKNLSITAEVKLEASSNRKILILSSPIVFVNNTCRDVTLQFSRPGSSVRNDSVGPKMNIPVPFDFVGGKFAIKFSNSQQYSSEIAFDKLTAHRDVCAEVNFDKKYAVLRVVGDPNNPHRTLVYVEPPYRIKNCLPKTLCFQLISERKTTSITKAIQPGEL